MSFTILKCLQHSKHFNVYFVNDSLNIDDDCSTVQDSVLKCVRQNERVDPRSRQRERGFGKRERGFGDNFWILES